MENPIEFTVLGNPIVRKKNGDIVEWTATSVMDLDGSNNVNTGFIPFDGKDFVLRLTATLPTAGNSNKSTLLNAMDESNTNYHGFCIRKSSALQNKLYYGNSSIVISDTDDIDITIRKTGTVLTLEYNGKTMTISSDYNIDRLTFVLGSSVATPGSNDYYRYAKATIKHFSVRKIS